MVNDNIQDLLYEIPENTDYAAEAKELAREDISMSRIQHLEDLLGKVDETFEIAMLLTAWGYDSGFSVLREFFDNNVLKGYINNRQYGYDETYKHVLDNLILYMINQNMIGNVDKAKTVYPYIKLIIKDSAKEMYDLDPLVTFLKISDDYQEVINLIENNLEQLTPDDLNFYWRVRSDLRLIEKYDTVFVRNYMAKYHLTTKDIQ